MKKLIENIRVLLNISQEDVDDWSIVSKESIARGEIELLSDKGLLQCIDLIAYNLATDTHIFLSNHPEPSIDEMFDDFGNTEDLMDDLHDVISLASGIHPDILFEIFSLRADYYSNLYVQMLENYE
jgi:hypothetical protein